VNGLVKKKEKVAGNNADRNNFADTIASWIVTTVSVYRATRTVLFTENADV
jgi:hypothetical protein